MIPGDLISYINYFKDWANDHPDVRFFCFGSAELGIAYARSLPSFDYPFVWLEQPVIESLDNGGANFSEAFITGITVLFKAPGDKPDKQVEAYAKALRIVYDLQTKLKKDRKNGLVNFEWNGMKKETVNQLWADNHYGWRLEVPLEFNINSLLV
ncbi:hypothetical protein [Siphonobacter sp. SORGH_AS_1065]|uniref:hypothetical protein n=1 Tax=Siphonobacter sp. SORGH_AS_1065 TaxID=3041795 RepID=UPI00277F3BC4|nr:hypothetical protein [Siphonobacter sp. SORGH_AS_1065]MDQ1088985.1 hypothetical protein [Siphonobacter sp. SORGH_AS_1065]